MILLLLLVLLPLAAEAQVRFGPLRLDDSLAVNYYYPQVVSYNDTTLRCSWASLRGVAALAHGQLLDVSGTLVGPRFVLDSANGQFTCPPSVSVLPLTNGGQARLVYHS